MKTKSEALAAMQTLKEFMGVSQTATVMAAMRGEERQYFYDKMCELAAIVDGMPKTYEQDGKGDDAIIYLHYFTKNLNFYITEKDAGTPDEPGQHQAFGVSDFGYGQEKGYISLVEILANDTELDFHFKPRTINELNGVTVEPDRAAEIRAELEREVAELEGMKLEHLLLSRK